MGTEAVYDPFEGVRGFRYSGDVHAQYPLSPKTKMPAHIRRPNYGREAYVHQADAQLFPSRRIRVNNEEEQAGVRTAAKVRTSSC